jgi:acyl dehydratase
MINLAEGQEKQITVVVSESTVESFISISGDAAPLHVDVAFAQRAGFSGRVVHGALLAAYVSRLVGMELPGRLSVMERMDLAFRQPVYAPCELTIAASVRQISEAVSSVVLDIKIADQSGRIVATGKTWHRLLDEDKL